MSGHMMTLAGGYEKGLGWALSEKKSRRDGRHVGTKVIAIGGHILYRVAHVAIDSARRNANFTTSSSDFMRSKAWPNDREQRARIIGEWLQTEARFLA
jgi:hypothetical protein